MTKSTRCYKGVPEVTKVTKDYTGLQRVNKGPAGPITGGYKGFERRTRGYLGLQGVTRGFMG